MNIYDEAHALARSIQNAEEMKRLVAAKEALVKDQAAEKMVRDFMRLQMQMEYARITGEEKESEREELQKLAVLVENNRLAAEYLQAFGRWQRTAMDVQKIIGDAMRGGMLEWDLPAEDQQA